MEQELKSLDVETRVLDEEDKALICTKLANPVSNCIFAIPHGFVYEIPTYKYYGLKGFYIPIIGHA